MNQVARLYQSNINGQVSTDLNGVHGYDAYWKATEALKEAGFTYSSEYTSGHTRVEIWTKVHSCDDLWCERCAA